MSKEFLAEVAWLEARWAQDAEAAPTKTHAHAENVEPDSLLGSPREMPALTRWVLDPNAPFASIALSDDAFTSRAYVRPLARAMEVTRRHPGNWPVGVPGPYALIHILRAQNWNIERTSYLFELWPQQVHDLGILAIRRVRRNYRELVPPRIIDKSEAQLDAEYSQAS